MQDLFYLLLGVAVIVLPIYFIVKVIKNKGKKEKNVKEKSNIKEPRVDKPKEKSVGKIFAIIFGGVVGFITKISPTLKGRSFRAKFAALCMGMINSMFIAYISYEILLSIIDKQGLVVALSGMAAFTGTDLLIITQNKIIELIKRQMDNI